MTRSPLPEINSAGSLLGEFFAQGIEAADLPALFPLLRARETLNAFITLFRGGEDEVLVRLMVLREIGMRADVPYWSSQELQAHFAYLDTVKLDTVLKRLRENDLLVWDAEQRIYQLSAAGRVTLSALATLLSFAGENDAELGYITAQVAAGQAVGKISAETLQHLLGRLNELQNEFDQAVLAGSEFRLRRSQEKLASVWHWVEKGTEIIRAITADGDLDTATYRIAHSIGQAQSRMLRMTGVFQRAVNSLERQRVHLGQSGLSSSDIVAWLRKLSQERLVAIANQALIAYPQPLFVTPNEMLDTAEYELLEREREKAAHSILPPSSDAPETGRIEAERLVLLEQFLGNLNSIATDADLGDVVVGGDYPQAAYRMSLLALLNDTESGILTGPVAELATAPFRLNVSRETRKINRDGVREISVGMLERTGP
ncbi:MAG: hypothetical protein AABY81_04405 [Pseudomonadota bacterium]